jgi:hypothetical protein
MDPALVNLQDEYRAWLDTLTPNLEGSRLAEKLKRLPSSTLRSCRQSTHLAATAATDRFATDTTQSPWPYC